MYWPGGAIALPSSGLVEQISLDHDLGDDSRRTGYEVMLWIEESVALTEFKSPVITVHSANTSPRHKMLLGIESFENLVAQGGDALVAIDVGKT